MNCHTGRRTRFNTYCSQVLVDLSLDRVEKLKCIKAYVRNLLSYNRLFKLIKPLYAFCIP